MEQNLKQIYKPIQDELSYTEDILRDALKKTKNESTLRANRYLLESGGKRIRPALMILCAKASSTNGSRKFRPQLAKAAAAIEIIHMASLIHDDVIDKARLRHNRLSVYSKWGESVSIALGDYFHSLAFELISECKNSKVLQCLSAAAKTMCEGELLQVWGRNDWSLSEKQCIIIVKKKTAALFSASCRVGGLLSNTSRSFVSSFGGYGLNLGITFQIVDDYLDFMGDQSSLGKILGQDMMAGEITLPILNLLESVSQSEKEQLRSLLAVGRDKKAFLKIRKMLLRPTVAAKTRKTAASFIKVAQEKINVLHHSPYKRSLFDLAGFIFARGFNSKS